MKKTYLFLILLAGFNSFAQKISSTEKKIIEHIKTNATQTEKLLEQVVNINSGTLNHEGVRQVGKIFSKEFEEMGFTTEWVSLPDSLNRAGHLVAYRTGKKGKKLFLIGHLDTVFEKSMSFTPFTRLNDSIATGQGVNDMKGGDVMIIAALKALQAQKLLDDTSITIYFTGDEESSGKPTSISRKDFIDRAKQSDIALAYETAVSFNIAATARRGSSGWELTTTGKTGHSSGLFSQNMGYGAIYEAARILDEFREALSSEKYLTFNPGVISGGTEVSYDPALAKGEAIGKTNIIAQKVIVQGDLRFISEMQKENARNKMREIVARHLNGTSAEIKFSDGIPAMEPTQANADLLKVLNQVSLDLNMGEVKAGDPGSRGAGDISYIAQYVPCLDGLGASGKGAHAPGEIINLKEFPGLTQRTALLIYRLTQ
ncbi:M20/M25/M40 family metallo-hydrolase [Emticicia sp. BO119]|uniref:M20/M25/M40 family metallo-hydrolase n=1 Tax=Emticicia sp. BO119 TaxID=2757768 RepID=UPI0015F0B7DD|nr:M20/M25/M40 family metallo-hydrolase [Emticicia sp. BO119]MBA4849194.1 M20/M25/M40 family metallo-hydrolase [Emticicia sp. BO119]